MGKKQDEEVWSIHGGSQRVVRGGHTEEAAFEQS